MLTALPILPVVPTAGLLARAMAHARRLARAPDNPPISPARQARALDNADADHAEARSGPIENLAKAQPHLPAQVEISIQNFFS
jgi:hypothetical protein